MKTSKDERLGWLRGDTQVDYAPDMVRLMIDIEEAVALLRGYEQWEADLVLTNEAWGSDLPRLTESLYDSFMELQAKRNAFLKEPDA